MDEALEDLEELYEDAVAEEFDYFGVEESARDYKMLEF